VDVCVIANPISGGGRGEARAQALCLALKERGLATDLFLTTQAGDARRHAATLDTRYVVSVGGDGTLNEVVNGLGDRPIAVAVLPMGTANVVARELNSPTEPEALAALIAEGRSMPMDAGEHGGERFLLGAGAGIDAAVTHAVSAQRGKRSSIMRWVWPTIRTCLRYSFPAIRVEVDGKVISDEAQYAIVGNCIYSAGIFPTTPRAKIDDGLLDVCLFHNLGYLRLIRLALTVRRPTFIEHPDVTYVQGRNISFQCASDTPVPLQVDGDPAGELAAEFRIQPSAIRVVTPRATTI